nr:phage minor head protein [Segatella oris]
MGLHSRYKEILNDEHAVACLAGNIDEKQQERLHVAFKSMMKGLFRQKGASLDINIITSKEAQAFIETHADVLNSAFEQTKMSSTMRDSLEHSTYIFSGLKTFHELNEAFPSLVDEQGNKKPFERFLNDVQKVDKTYNEHYLRAEYNFTHAAADMAAKWEEFTEDGDRYNLQYRTVGDDHVRPEHAALNGTTLPFSDAFWDSYYPPNGWNCRCTVVQVRKTKYPETPREEAYRRGAEALANDTRGMFRFNPGKQGKAMPDYNPYSIRRCNDCDLAKGKTNLAFVPENELCAACRLVRQCFGDKSKSERAIERIHYLHEMEPLLKVKHEKPIEGGTIKVGFSTYGNKHLFSDTFGRSKVLEKDDLASLDKVLRKATFIESSPLTHPRTDGVDRFYYFEGEIRGKKVRLNVARKADRKDNGFIRITHFLYSINDM